VSERPFSYGSHNFQTNILSPSPLVNPILGRCKDFRESERFLTWTQHTEPIKTDDGFSSMPLFEVANKNNENGRTKINMHFKKKKKTILGEKIVDWSLIKTLTQCHNTCLCPDQGKGKKCIKSAVC